MRRVLVSLVAIAAVLATASLPAIAHAGKRHGPSGVKGTVFNTTCPGPCAYPQSSPPYTGGGLTVEVRRAGNGELVASKSPTDGTFRIRVKRGLYLVSATAGPIPAPTTTQTTMPPPDGCWQSDSQQVKVRPHRFTQVDLHVTNVCIL